MVDLAAIQMLFGQVGSMFDEKKKIKQNFQCTIFDGKRCSPLRSSSSLSAGGSSDLLSNSTRVDIYDVDTNGDKTRVTFVYLLQMSEAPITSYSYSYFVSSELSVAILN